METKAVTIVTIKGWVPLYKGEELATKVELINFEENGFSVIVEKDLYAVGSHALFIIPDYCITDDFSFFENFIRPGGDESKSYLGKINGVPARIRAKKFNLHKGDGVPIYSNGILLPLYEVADALQMSEEELLEMPSEKLTYLLKVTKYEEPETVNNKMQQGYTRKGGFPEGVYKTDETNINLLWNHIENNIGYPVTLIGTEKVDGSSISIGITPQYPNGFIASRNINKALTTMQRAGKRPKTFWETIMFWRKPDLNVYEEVDNNDIFVTTGKPYLDMMLGLGMKNTILRGELNGAGTKGSGNKNNPSTKYKTNIVFFNADNYIAGEAVKMSYDDLMHLCINGSFPMVTMVFKKTFNSREEIEIACKEYFKQQKKENNKLIEGIVLTTEDCIFSAKFMNDEYDSKK